jgi:integrase
VSSAKRITGRLDPTRSPALSGCLLREEEAPVERIGVYAGTKHSTATALKAAGSDDRVLATLMGHSDVRSVERYAHVQTQVIRSTLAILDCVSSVSPADTK